ncbi:alpha/beta fold hydrolase [Vallitalea maricola]|uniref:Alpha/beta hydrolase n=1 Tax=Vallitalea maricola TaxID=3074433 RepID=A0ACB5ULL3_9FIRM|nr:alpha/beta hydrolase [Vallitalea sp. AN17-2]
MKKHTKNLFYFLISLITISLINKIIFITSTIRNNLFSCNSYYYGWKFGKLFYTVQGKGKPILLIHSLYMGSSDYEFKKIVKNLSSNHTVYTIDLIGYGRSDKPKITYTAFLYVQLISDFINEVIKEKTDVIASSSSSSFVTMACYQNPDIFDKLLFINPASIASLQKNPSKKDKLLKYVLETPILGTTIYNIACSKYILRANLRKRFYYNKKLVRKKYITIYHEASHLQGSNNKFLYASKCCKYLNVSINNAVENINNSIYILMGDNGNSEDIINSYLTLNPAIEYSYVHDTKLLPHLEKPADIIDICNIYFN